MNHNFTKHTAEIFFKELWEDAFVQGDADKLATFYTNDVIGHYGDEIITFNDIKCAPNEFNTGRLET